MRYLLLNLFWVLLGCTSYPKNQNFTSVEINDVNTTVINPYFSNTDTDYVYRANISVYDNTFGGIFIVKKINNNEHRVVFTTEMGNKIFDFSYLKDEFKVNFVIDKLDNRLLINVLKNDFKALITEKASYLKVFKTDDLQIKEISIYNKKHYYFIKNNQLNKIIRTKNKKEKVIFNFSKISGNFVQNIDVVHQNIKLKINLNKI